MTASYPRRDCRQALRLALLMSSAIGWSSLASAQDAPPAPGTTQAPAEAPTPAPAPPTAGAAAVPATDAAQAVTRAADTPSADGSDIVVTAQRREERLQDVPASISAFSGATLNRLNLNDSSDLTRVTPGLQIDRSTFVPQPQIRGIGSRSQSIGEESSVPLYIDGVYQPFLTASVFQLSGIERIEVLRGPQGALYGRNSTGGAINVVTRTPSAGFRGDANASYGRFNEVILRGSVDGGSDTVAASLSGVYNSDGGYLRDIGTGRRTGGVESFGVRGRVLWKPSERLTFSLAGSYESADDRLSFQTAPVGGNTLARRLNPPPLLPTDRYDVQLGPENVSPLFRMKQHSVSLTANWDLGAVAVTGISAYVHQDYNNDRVNNAGVLSNPILYYGDSGLSGAGYYNEVYLQPSSSSRFNWIVGGVFFDLDSRYSSFYVYQRTSLTGAGVLTTHGNSVHARSLAAYAQGTLEVVPRLFVTAGVRYTNERSTLDVRDFRSGTVPNPFVPNAVPFANVAPVNLEAKKSWNPFTPSGSIRYEFSDQANVYARVARGFKSGIFSPGGRGLIPADPEYITQYEVGAKFSPMPQVLVSIAGFYSDYTDLQVQSRDPVTNSGLLQNASNAKIKGGELEITARPITGLFLNAGLALTYGRYGDFPAAQVTIPVTSADPTPASACVFGTGTPLGGNRTVFCDVSGNRLIRTPVVSGNVGGYYGFSVGGDSELRLSGNASYRGKYYWDALNRLEQSDQIILDAEVSLKPANVPFTVGIWGKNLTNQYYDRTLISGTLQDVSAPGRPRSYGVRISATF